MYDRMCAVAQPQANMRQSSLDFELIGTSILVNDVEVEGFTHPGVWGVVFALPTYVCGLE